MTRYEELKNEIETATTKAALKHAQNGVAAARAFRSISQEEAQELWDDIERRLRLPL